MVASSSSSSGVGVYSVIGLVQYRLLAKAASGLSLSGWAGVGRDNQPSLGGSGREHAFPLDTLRCPVLCDDGDAPSGDGLDVLQEAKGQFD
jgi:hypothetical protein